MLTAEYDWRTVLEHARSTNTRAQRYFLTAYWRGLSYREHAGEADALMRAYAFRNVCAHVSPIIPEGSRIAGSISSFYADTLPSEISRDEFEAALDDDTAKGRRFFQVGWDHTLGDYARLCAEGIDGFIERAKRSRAMHAAKEECDTIDAMIISLEAFSLFIERHAQAATMVGDASMAEGLHHIAHEPPRTLQEAIALVWLTHILLSGEGRTAMALGRIDQYLYPFYRRDIDTGCITREDALELFCHLWAKIEEHHDVTNICIGGLTPDGEDATNELFYIALEATALVESPSTNLSARFHDGTDERFYRACFDVIKTGVGFPAIFNDHVLIEGLMRIGIPLSTARDYCMVGCIETMFAGRQPAWGDSRFNILSCVSKSLERISGESERSFELLWGYFIDSMRDDLLRHVDHLNGQFLHYPAERFSDPFLSALTSDCIGRAKDVNAGGAEFERFHGIAGMGLASAADALAAVRTLVFTENAVSYDELMTALEKDFIGHEPLRRMLLNRAPKYGNNDPLVDDIAAEIVSVFTSACLSHRIVGGGRYVACMAANVQNIPAGKEVKATPDGRHAYTPLSDAASPYFGRDAKGPTAFLSSVAVPDTSDALGGTVINMRFDPEHYSDDDGAGRFISFMRFFVEHRIQELQFNFTRHEDLVAAQHDPERYKSLVVRVSGFSAYFTGLSTDVQNDVIRRRAHG
ncbi:MAG: pyruvate formate lyase family protein [Spirochaetota bacterium]